MGKQVRLDDETFVFLVRLKGFVILKTGVDMSNGDMIQELMAHYPLRKLNIPEDDELFKMVGDKAE